MIPGTWQEVPLKTSPEFLEEIGFRGIAPSGHPISPLAAAKDALSEHFSEEINKLAVPPATLLHAVLCSTRPICL